MSDAMLCVRNGEVRALVIIEDDEIFRETMAEWAADPATEAILKVTVETARAAFLQPAAGLICSLFSQPAPAHHLRGEPTGYLVKRYDLNGVLLDTELSFTKPVIRSTAKTEFVPLYADLATTEGSTDEN